MSEGGERMKEETKLEDIEGFEDLSEYEKEYFRVMQGEAEFRMSHHYSPGIFEIAIEMICWTLYIIYSAYSKRADNITYFSIIFILSDLIYLFEEYFQK